ncbi:MAG: CHRD domain-containing protein [Acidimicrobiales bacterium]
MTSIRRLVVGAAVAATITVGAAAPAAADRDQDHRFLHTIMTGAEEVPGPGDPDGAGVAGVFVHPPRGVVCYVLAVRNIAPATAAHIHRGPAGVEGPVVVGLDAPSGGVSADCTTVDPDLAREIAGSPEQFYVNVHNEEFPAGAIRGQLR